MNLITRVWTNWSNSEKIENISLFLAIFFLLLLLIYLFSKNRKITLLSAISLILVAIFNTLGIIITNTLFRIEIVEIFKIVPILTLLILASNIGVLLGTFNEQKNRKGFNISNIRVEYFSDTFKQTIFLLLLGSSIFLFLPVLLQSILAISILSALLAIWSIYWISKYLLK
ncbi:MAG: hypothetical protein ACOX0X_00955 [Candidatus Dojkabacteria bacterium]